MNPDQGNPYQFIVEPPKPQRPSLFKFGGGGSFITKLVFIVGGAVLLMIVMFVVASVFLGGGSNIDGTVKLTQSATELVRLGETGEKANDQAIKNAAATTAVTMETQKQSWVAWLSENGREIDEEELALGQSAATDQRLTKAEQTSDFDSEYTEVMRDGLSAYSTELQTLYKGTSDEETRAMLNEDFEEVKLLLLQWPE